MNDFEYFVEQLEFMNVDWLTESEIETMYNTLVYEDRLSVDDWFEYYFDEWYDNELRNFGGE